MYQLETLIYPPFLISISIFFLLYDHLEVLISNRKRYEVVYHLPYCRLFTRHIWPHPAALYDDDRDISFCMSVLAPGK